MHDRIRYLDNEADRTGVDDMRLARNVKKCCAVLVNAADS